MRLRHPVQIRTFRFGIWSSCFDSAYHRELRRRHRSLRHKYIDGVNQRLSWHDLEHPLAEESRRALKRAVARIWTPSASRGTPRWANFDEFINREMFPSRPSFAAWGSYVDQIINPPLRQTSSDTRSQRGKGMKADNFAADSSTKSSGPRDTAQSGTGSTVEKDYIIDPITNRRVPKREHGPAEINLEPSSQATKTFNGSNPELKWPPVSSHDKRLASEIGKELNKYAESKFDDWPAASTRLPVNPPESSSHAESAPQVLDNSNLKSEEYALNHLPPEDPIEDNGDIPNFPTIVPDELPEKPSGSSRHQDEVDSAGGQSFSHINPYHQPISESEKMQSELRDYGPYMHHEDAPMHTHSKDLKDIERYRYSASDEPGIPTQPPTINDETRKYEFTILEDFKDQDQPFEQYGDLEKYKAFRFQHLETTAPPERDIVTESLKEYETKDHNDIIVDISNPSAQAISPGIPQIKQLEGHLFSKHYCSQTGAESNALSCETTTGKHLEHFPAAWHSDMNGDSTGNEFAVIKTLQPERNQCIAQNTEKGSGDSHHAMEKEVSQSASDRPRNGPKLELALDRCASITKGGRLRRASDADFYSKEPQGLETSFSEECRGKHTLPLYTRTYSSEPGQVASTSKFAAENRARESTDRSSDLFYDRDPEIDGLPPSESIDTMQDRKVARPEEPTVYKILAYDPTAQTISVAETNSVVSDAASPLSPTEVLLRLSNPTKFLPHFASLQAEGFELVSGGGDVLVFRQAQPAKGTTSVNPIDLMGRSTAVPNAAAFVSPTGFVNYDMPRVEDEIAAQAYRSRMGVRREDRVFNGQESSPGDKGSNKPKMKAGKRMIIGGVWVAGLSYALGVVSEYFTTGGTDGQGPTGFSPV